MKKRTARRFRSFIWVAPAVLAVSAAAYLRLNTGPERFVPPAGGMVLDIYVTNELNCYREPCG
ncbi:MAG: hypothetical protein MUF59_03970 [Candidatus Krumholzibacteria bacterium]|jgi:hypothetical protein|nr:hypothetical protein [Candidatus Krumholzibacteria bacterium]